MPADTHLSALACAALHPGLRSVLVFDLPEWAFVRVAAGARFGFGLAGFAPRPSARTQTSPASPFGGVYRRAGQRAAGYQPQQCDYIAPVNNRGVADKISLREI